MGVGVAKAQETKGALFKNRNFLTLFISTLISSPGYYIYLIGAEWLMLTMHDNRFYFGMLFVAASIPRLLFMAVGGIVADRFNKRNILFISDFTRALFILALLYFLITNSITVWHLIFMAALFGISDAFSYPATNSLVPTIIEEDQLQKGNSFIQMTTLLSPIFGPALGGTMIALIGFQGVFTVAFTMLLVASIIILFIRSKENSIEEKRQTPWEDFKEGFHYVSKHELIRSIMVLALLLNFFFTGPIAIGLPIIVKDVFLGDSISLAIVQSSLGVGALIGTVLLATITLKKTGTIMVWSLTLMGILYICIGFSVHLFITAGVVVIMALLTQFINIPIITTLQKTTEQKMLGRMMSFLMTVSTGLVPISYFVTSLLISIGVRMQIIIIVGGIVITALALYSFRNKKIVSLQ